MGIARKRSYDEFAVRVGRWERAADPVGAARTADEVHAAREVDARFTEAGFTLAAYGGVRVPTVNVVCDQATFEAHLAHAAGGPEPAPADPGDLSRRCGTVDGVPVYPRDVAAALVGYVRRVVLDAAGVVVDAGRKRRLFTGALREVMWVHGSQCLWPGCGTTAREHDHSDEWVSGHGCTEPGNCGPMCARHNRWTTTHGYTTCRDPDGVWHVYRPDGTDITHPRAA